MLEFCLETFFDLLHPEMLRLGEEDQVRLRKKYESGGLGYFQDK